MTPTHLELIAWAVMLLIFGAVIGAAIARSKSRR